MLSVSGDHPPRQHLSDFFRGEGSDGSGDDLEELVEKESESWADESITSGMVESSSCQ